MLSNTIHPKPGLPWLLRAGFLLGSGDAALIWVRVGDWHMEEATACDGRCPRRPQEPEEVKVGFL